MVQPFHLAIPVTNLTDAEAFYGELLGCEKGRSDTQWIDWNFFGHQLVTHCVEAMPSPPSHNGVDDHAVPVPHFGVVLGRRSCCAGAALWRCANHGRLASTGK